MAGTFPIAYLNGSFADIDSLSIPVLDRGFLFGDGVYEVIPVYNGQLFRLDGHLDRLERSLREVSITNPLSRGEWETILKTLVTRNGAGNQAVYLQVTRGSDKGRDHRFPQDIAPTVFAMTSPLPEYPKAWLERGVTVTIMDDVRWGRNDIKSISLIANVMARQRAHENESAEAVLIKDGKVIECSASSIFIVKDGVIITPPKSHALLPGVTQDFVLELARTHKLPYREQDISLDELLAADEVWMTSSIREVTAITRIDDKQVGNGLPGPVWRKMYDHFQAYKRAHCKAA